MFNPTSPIYSLDAFLVTFGIPGIYTAPGGGKRAVRVIYQSAFAPVVSATGAVVTN